MTLRVGKGEFAPVGAEIWKYSVSGLQVVKSWLDYRKSMRKGRKSSPLDRMRPERWQFAEELLKLIWVLELTISLQPEGEGLLDKIVNSSLLSAGDLPTPSAEERRPPRIAQSVERQFRF